MVGRDGSSVFRRATALNLLELFVSFLTPSVNYVAVLGSDTSDAAGDDDSLFYAGVGFAYGF